jgi:hypothetical protein
LLEPVDCDHRLTFPKASFVLPMLLGRPWPDESFLGLVSGVTALLAAPPGGLWRRAIESKGRRNPVARAGEGTWSGEERAGVDAEEAFGLEEADLWYGNGFTMLEAIVPGRLVLLLPSRRGARSATGDGLLGRFGAFPILSATKASPKWFRKRREYACSVAEHLSHPACGSPWRYAKPTHMSCRLFAWWVAVSSL